MVLRCRVASFSPDLFKAERAAGARQVDRRDLHVLTEGDGSGGVQRLHSVDKHPQRAIGKARGHSVRARAVQVVGVFDLHDDAVVESVGVGGQDRQTWLGRGEYTARQNETVSLTWQGTTRVAQIYEY